MSDATPAEAPAIKPLRVALDLVVAVGGVVLVVATGGSPWLAAGFVIAGADSFGSRVVWCWRPATNNELVAELRRFLQFRWVQATALIGCVLASGGSLADLGIVMPSWQVLVAGVVTGVLIVALAVVALTVNKPAAQSVSDEPGHLGILGMPLRMRAFLLVTAAACEEVVVRGFLLEQIADISGSIVVGAVVTFVLFTLQHIGFFTLRSVLNTTMIGAAGLTIFYAVTRNLPATILVHLVVDSYLLAGPRLIAPSGASARLPSSTPRAPSRPSPRPPSG